ncbi:UNVERIFIED_CONTAM: hypothetical protein Sradi_6851100 [Sesamum radiatum]|uniref:Uncharacterized protein n=1 Tax=Sesamum radiatum TaxID=300843 RepID=A0AAW2JKF6_SESRA
MGEQVSKHVTSWRKKWRADLPYRKTSCLLYPGKHPQKKKDLRGELELRPDKQVLGEQATYRFSSWPWRLPGVAPSQLIF